MFRPMRRFKQQLSAERCAEILKTEKRGVLSVIGDGGYPYAVPMNFVYDNGNLYFHSAVTGHKLDAVKNDPKASFCVMTGGELSGDGWSYFVESVIAFGRVTVVEDEAVRTEKLRRIGNKYFPDEQKTEEELAKNAGRALVLELAVEHLSGKRVHED